MPVTYTVEPPSLFLVRASGKVTHAEASSVLGEIGEDERLAPGARMLIDGREGTGTPIRMELRHLPRQLAAHVRDVRVDFRLSRRRLPDDGRRLQLARRRRGRRRRRLTGLTRLLPRT